MAPEPHRVVARRHQTGDVVTLELAPVDGESAGFRAGQFNMLTAFGVGEVAISISSAPRRGAPVEHTVRDVGAVTHALCTVGVGDIVGVRGPFGTDWGLDAIGAVDVVVVAGGIGLAPLRGAINELAERSGGPDSSNQVALVVGARSPDQIVFADDLDRWRGLGVHVEVTVDVAGPGWDGSVGVVTALLPGVPFDPANAVAMVCGPEIMMRFTVRALADRAVPLERIRVSLERNMQCGLGWCGHCQLGPFLLCRDGPVLSCSPELLQLVAQRER